MIERLGGEPASWRWGALHAARFEHPLLRAVPVLRDLTGITVAAPGDDQTVNRGGMADGFTDVHGAGLRLVADLSGADGLLAVIATGQSGNPLSRHWSDFAARWATGRTIRLGSQADEAGQLQLRPIAPR